MISLDDAVIARYLKDNLCFEILVDPEKARKIKSGEDISLEEVVAAREVFSDSKKAERATESDLNKVFGTNDFEKITRIIIQRGEIQLTTEQRKKMQEARRKQLISLIARAAVDPRTHIPHPPQRIEKALDESKIHVDPFKSAEEQMENALKAIRVILPIKIESVKVAVKVPAQYAGSVCGFIHEHKMIKEEWKNDGSYLALIEISAGLQGEFFDRLNKMTHGEVETKVTERM